MEQIFYGILQVLFFVIVLAVGTVIWVIILIRRYVSRINQPATKSLQGSHSMDDLDEERINILLNLLKKRKDRFSKVSCVGGLLLMSNDVFAGTSSSTGSILNQPGILITLVLVAIPLLLMISLFIVKAFRMIRRLNEKVKEEQVASFVHHIQNLNGEEFESDLLKRKAAFDYHLVNTELAGLHPVDDKRGLIRRVHRSVAINFISSKTEAVKYPKIDPRLSKLVLWYLGCATAWLIFGTTIGEYLGIKFLAPDVDHQSWLSFGRLRPVHTNAVFWGWSSLAMLGLGYYVVPIVSNTSIASIRQGYISLILINSCVIVGSLCLITGINNAGGEYREYVWPVMALFGAGLLITLRNYILTIAKRKTAEIYISNWYIVSAIIFTLVIVFVAYWPTWQNGLGETIVQGYYMHQGVGMWFMLFTLGLVYYFLPQQLNKPIYSYSLGILAFWTQILFYTLIGTHHFVFSAIPWWLQTVAIVGSVGMLIPVTAGTVNFLMTYKGSWNQIGNSYILPFFLVGIVFYFTGSYQGTAEAFRFTNLLWHFTDFTVAHSHLTMYGIIAFFLWGSMYVIVPRVTGNEPSQVAVGAHFWLALIGLMFYAIPLMAGGTLKGLMWMEGKPFMESVVMMAPFWLWRAIGGTLMWVSHIVFAFNFCKMVQKKQTDIQTMAFKKLRELKATV